MASICINNFSNLSCFFGSSQAIEGLNVASDQYAILDGGSTLELSKALHAQIKETPEFKAFESIDGNHYCFDDDEWVVESGVTSKAIPSNLS